MMLRNQKGFTLIELLIVVVIIGILAAIAIPKFSATREKAYYSSMRADLRNLATQQELYYTSGGYDYVITGTIDQDGNDDLDFTPSSGVTVTLGGNADPDWWSAVANHSALGGEGCAVFHGDGGSASTPGGTAAPRSGVIVCDDGQTGS